MKPQILLSLTAIATMILACNVPSPSGQALPAQTLTQMTTPPSGETTSPATNTPSAEPPTATLTLLPQDTPTITPSPTPSIPTVTPAKDPVNCRFGPGVEWLTVGALKVGENATILGKTGGGAWWYVQLPSNPANSCWVAASVTVPAGNYQAVAIVAPPEAIVVKVSLELKPTEVTVPGCTFPYTPIDLKGTITTNGPAEVEWHWETSQGDASPLSILKFEKFDAFSISDYVKYSKEGNYWVKLVVTKPNSMVAQAKYKVVCGP